MKAAIIATVFNEAKSIELWLNSLAVQTRLPQEIIIVDGGSTDDTAWRIGEFFSKTVSLRGKGTVLQRKCNIAHGRNIAIRAASAEVIVSTDAGSILDPAWFEGMIDPFERGADLVSGWTECHPKNQFQEKLRTYTEESLKEMNPGEYLPSSRTIAFRKTVWEAVGGYPEWLTLTGEDALFNQNLKMAGFTFTFQPNAVVYWEPRPTFRAFLRQMYRYGYGAAEARLFGRQYLKWGLTTFCPPLIVFSKHPLRDIPFRFLRNAASALGWIVGKVAGKRPPPDWEMINGVLLSPQTKASLSAKYARLGAIDVPQKRT